MKKLMAAALLCLLGVNTAHGQDDPAGTDREGIYIIFDGSNSMWGELPDKSRKITVAKDVLTDFVAGDFAGQDVALRVYGHRRTADCTDTNLEVPFSDPATSIDKIRQTVQAVSPRGKTPITRSLIAALEDFGDRQGDVLLISDGIETCDQDPCELMAEWRDKGIDIRVHVVGFGLDEVARSAMTCVAETSGGKYFDAESADQLAGALDDARTAALSDKPEPGTPTPEPQVQGYELKIVATDDQGRAYVVKGPLTRDGGELGEVGSYRRNAIEAPGDYEIEVGPVLQDGTIYKPVRVPVSIKAPGQTVVDVTVTRPAILTSRFMEDGGEHKGALIRAYSDDEEVFTVRPYDEVLVRPGTYAFRSTPNKDNELTLTETLVEGAATELVFELVKTVPFKIVFKLPNGEDHRQNSVLLRDGEKVYDVHSSNGGWAQPGTYTLVSDDRETPFPPTAIEIHDAEEQVIEAPMPAGFLVISYADSPYYHSQPDRAHVEALDRKGGAFGRLNKPITLAPGRYRVIGQDSKGEFDDIEVELKSGESAEVIFEPKPQGWIIVTYAPSDAYRQTPDRASIVPLEKQRLVGSNAINKKRMVPPGRYRIEGWSAVGNIEPQEIEVKAGETMEVELRLAN